MIQKSLFFEDEILKQDEVDLNNEMNEINFVLAHLGENKKEENESKDFDA